MEFYKLKCFFEGDKFCILVIFFDDFIIWWLMYLLMFSRYIFEMCLFWSKWCCVLVIVVFEIIGFECVEDGELILFFLDGFLCKGNKVFVMYWVVFEFFVILFWVCVFRIFCFCIMWCEGEFLGREVILDVIWEMFVRLNGFECLFVLLVVEVCGWLVCGWV